MGRKHKHKKLKNMYGRKLNGLAYGYDGYNDDYYDDCYGGFGVFGCAYSKANNTKTKKENVIPEFKICEAEFLPNNKNNNG